MLKSMALGRSRALKVGCLWWGRQGLPCACHVSPLHAMPIRSAGQAGLKGTAQRDRRTELVYKCGKEPARVHAYTARSRLLWL